MEVQLVKAKGLRDTDIFGIYQFSKEFYK